MERPIGVFDSGIGGISVLKRLLKVLPQEKYYYFADEINLPYGDKSPEEIQNLSKKAFDYFKKLDVKLAVLACNTATACAKPYLEANFDFPIFGVIQAGAKDKRLLGKKKVAILATKATIDSCKYQEEIAKFYPQIKSYGIACPGLADAIDAQDYPLIEDLIFKASEKIDADTDVAILACTHYPLVRDVFENIFKKKNLAPILIDPADGLAIEIENYIKKSGMKSSKGELHFYSTADLNEFISKSEKLLNK